MGLHELGVILGLFGEELDVDSRLEDSEAVAVELLLDVLVDLHQELAHNFWRRLAVLSDCIEVHLAEAFECHSTQYDY